MIVVGTKYGSCVNCYCNECERWNFCKIGVLVGQARWFNDENGHHSLEHRVAIYDSVSTADKTVSVTITG